MSANLAVIGFDTSTLPAQQEAQWTARNLESNGWTVLDITVGKLWYSTLILARKGSRWAMFTAHGSIVTTGKTTVDPTLHPSDNLVWDKLDLAHHRRHRDAGMPKAKARGRK